MLERLVDVGAHVNAGDVLARLDPAEQRAELDAATARTTFMSSTMRWRNGLIERVVIANASLVEVDTSIFRKAFSGSLR